MYDLKKEIMLAIMEHNLAIKWAQYHALTRPGNIFDESRARELKGAIDEITRQLDELQRAK